VNTLPHSNNVRAEMIPPVPLSAAGPAVRVRNLVKRYGPTIAVSDVSFDVQQGEVFALLGPNGAGKTTIIEVLEGYLRADGGEVQVLGLDPWRQAPQLRIQVGAMLQEGGVYPTMTPSQALALFARYYHNPVPPDELLRTLGLSDAATTRYRHLSGGQKQRLSLGLALIGRPRLLFLDEPTAGMDAQARRSAWELVSELKREGATVILTTHYLEEAEHLADRIAIIRSGVLVALDTPQALLQTETPSLMLRTSSPLPVTALQELPSATRVDEQEPGRYIVRTTDVSELLVEIALLLRSSRTAAVEIRQGGASLQDVFFSLTADEEPA